MTADDILSAVATNIFDARKQTLLPGSHWHDHVNEKDLLVLGSGKRPKLTEVEIKVSLSDWRRDAFKTTNRYKSTAHGITYVRKYESISAGSYLSGMLSRFYIACPRSLWEVAKAKLDDQALPPWAGVIAVGEPGISGHSLSGNCREVEPGTEIVREATEFKAAPIPDGTRAEFHRLCYFRFWSMRLEYQRLHHLARGLTEASQDYTTAVAEAWAAVAVERDARMAGEAGAP